MEFEKLITQRYSVRKFRPEHLAQQDVDAILAAVKALGATLRA